MTDVTSTPPAGTAPDLQAAEEELAALTAPLDGTRSVRFPLIQLANALVMTAAGAGARLAFDPGITGRAVAAGCAVLIAARLAAPPLARRRLRAAAPAWADAAAVHELFLAARVPAATLAAANRYLPAITAGSGKKAWLYVPRCAGTGQHSWRCEAAGVLQPGGGLLVVLGEHSAADPAVAAASLAHELGHQAGWTRPVLNVVHSARLTAGWGWAAAGLDGARFGWPGVLVFAAGFQAVSLLAEWTAEAACDRRAACAEGRATVLRAFAYIAARQAACRAAVPWWHRTGPTVVRWAAGPSHPPLALRRAIVAATTRP
jgi:hypothetical protein